MIIREIKTEKERELIFKFRYQIYENEMRRGCAHADHEKKMIFDSMDKDGFIFGVFENCELVATGRVNIASKGKVEPENVYQFNSLTSRTRAKSAVASKVMVDPSYRGAGIYLRLVKAMYRKLIELGVEDIYLDCNAPLDKLYGRLGFLPLRMADHPEFGSVMVMRLPARDSSHLTASKSPLLSELLEVRASERSYYANEAAQFSQFQFR